MTKEMTIKYISDKIYKFVGNNLNLVFGFAAAGIIFALIGHYGTCGFNWKRFLFFELPLYLFCVWALFKTAQMFKKFEQSRKIEQKENQQKENENNRKPQPRT